VAKRPLAQTCVAILPLLLLARSWLSPCCERRNFIGRQLPAQRHTANRRDAALWRLPCIVSSRPVPV